MASPSPPSPKSERESTTPFLLRLFFKQNSFHRTDDFTFDSQPREQLQIYTWPSCTLRELSSLLLNALPDLVGSDATGTRIAYRLVYPDPRGQGGGGGGGRMRAFDDYADDRAPRTRYLAKDLGSIVCGADGAPRGDGADGEPDRTLADGRFVIGDWVCVAVLPPLENGLPAPAPLGLAPRPGGDSGRSAGRGFGGGRRYENGFGGAPRSYDRGVGVPMGEWRRGERLPEGGHGRSGYGRARGRDW